jgi:uncharacterized protein
MQVKELATRPSRVFAVVMTKGERVAEGLERFAGETGVDAAALSAVGAVSQATLGFFDPVARDYLRIAVPVQAEVVSFQGDITRAEAGAAGNEDRAAPSEDPDGSVSRRTVHVHVVVSRSDGSTVGGHLLEATVNPTLEVIVTESPAHLRRRYDPETGLALVDLRQDDPAGGTAVADGEGDGR